MEKIVIPSTYKYIGVFLTLSCNLTCSYCINHLVGLKKGRKLLRGKDWVRALSRLSNCHEIPLTLQGGEPTIHSDFYTIVKELPDSMKLDLLTNIQFDPQKFAEQISPEKFNRDAPYAPIRVSYHPETMNLAETLEKVKRMQQLGFRIGLYSVLHPDQQDEIIKAQEICIREGIDFRTKEFLGTHNGKIYGTYAYEEAVFSPQLKSCLCRTTELLIDPFGDVYRCHHDLYNQLNPQGNLLDDDFKIIDSYKKCDYFGRCNPCDVKVKNNYQQVYGHTSVSILFEEENSLERNVV